MAHGATPLCPETELPITGQLKQRTDAAMLGRPQREGLPVLGEGLGTCSSLSQSSGFLELCWDSGAPGLVLRVQRASRDSSCGKKRRARPGWSGLNGESQGGTGWAVTVNRELGAGGPSQKGEARGARCFAGAVTKAGGCLFLGLSFALTKLALEFRG